MTVVLHVGVEEKRGDRMAWRFSATWKRKPGLRKGMVAVQDVILAFATECNGGERRDDLLLQLR